MSSGIKRARSPADDSSIEDRASKRPLVAIGAFYNRQLRHSSADSSRQGSEDLAHRANGLSIESPVYTPGDLHNPVLLQADEVAEGRSNDGDVEGDVEMAMDIADSPQQIQESGRQQLAPFHALSLDANFSGESYAQQLQQDPGQSQTPHRHPYPTRYSERLQSTVMPLINVVPATPVLAALPFQPHFLGSAPASVNAVTSSLDSGNLTHLPPATLAQSPSTSFAQFAPASSKKRVLFGPRANCEKCRLGAANHFIHYE